MLTSKQSHKKKNRMFKKINPALNRLVFRRLVLETVDSQDTSKKHCKKDKGMVRNIDNSTRMESNHQVFRRLFMETVDWQDTCKKYSKEDKRIVRSTGDSNRLDSSRIVLSLDVLSLDDSSQRQSICKTLGKIQQGG